MSQAPQKPSANNSALLKELQKRKTQQLQQALEEKRRPQTTGQTSPQTNPRRSTQRAPAVAPSPHTEPPVQTVNVPTPTQRLSRSRKAALTALCAGLLITGLCSATLLLATNSTVVPTSTLSVLPTVTAKEVVSYFKGVGLPITAVRELTVAQDTWAASQEVEVEVRRGTDKGLILVLSYAVPQQKITDLFRINTNTKFKEWQAITLSNVIMLTSPETPLSLRTEVVSHLAQFLDAPYRLFLPTATPSPTIPQSKLPPVTK